MAPKLSSAAAAAKGTLRGDGTRSRRGRSSIDDRIIDDQATRLCTVTELVRCRHEYALGGIVPRGRQLQRTASVEFFLSAPVLRPVSVPPLAEQFANSCATQLRFPGLLEWRVA